MSSDRIWGWSFGMSSHLVIIAALGALTNFRDAAAGGSAIGMPSVSKGN